MTTVVVTRPRVGVQLLTLNRPDRLNAMNDDMLDEFLAALKAAALDTTVRAVVLTGAGRAFCAGRDMLPAGGHKPLSKEDLGDATDRLNRMRRLMQPILNLRESPLPIIAAVNGHAIGAGFAIALACDLRLAAASAKFAVGFIKIGLSGCEMGVSWLLPRAVGTAAAGELMLTGRTIDAPEAARIGLVSSVVPDAELIDAALNLADELRANTPLGVSLTKEVMWASLEVGSLHAAMDLENRTQALATFGRHQGEAVAAMLERRVAQFE